MEFKHFRLIKAIVEEGNIAKSSDRLFLTQSALSHQLRELENQLGFPVFHRIRNKWKLTEEGEELYEIGIRILNELEIGFNKIDLLRLGAAGTIKLSTECYSFYQGLPSFMQKMGFLYPEVTVDLILEATHQPIPKLLSKEIDIAIVTHKTDNDSLVYKAVREDEIFAFAHKENPLCQVEFLKPEHFQEVHLIIHSFPLETVSIYQHYLKPNDSLPQQISAIPLTEVALEMVNANMGIICVPAWTLKSFQLTENIRRIPIGANGLKRRHYLTIRRQDAQKKYIKDFVSKFLEMTSNE
ncbi:MAG: LysR family transcriptional regulator [Bacteroidota bacterium]